MKSDSTNARLVYRVESGPHANFGKVVWKGTKYIHTKFLDKFVNWKPGDTYSLDQTTKMRDELSDTGLFTRVEVTPGPVDSEGNAPVVVDIAERKRHNDRRRRQLFDQPRARRDGHVGRSQLARQRREVRIQHQLRARPAVFDATL